ncbi:MAG: 6-phosphogluconolactonase [Methylococcales bacterium]
MQKNSRWHVLETAEHVAQAVYQRILDAAEQAIASRGHFKLVLAGGGTPEKVYQLLAQSEADWRNWYIYYGDERCLPVADKDRNSVMAGQAFLNKVPIPAAQIFTIPAELGPAQGAEQYQTAVADALPFDMVLLGMGEDGHTASLFPGHQHAPDQFTHAVYNSPKPPPERVSISAGALSNTHELIFLITGSNKQEAVSAWKQGDNLPVATVVPDNGIDVFIDQDADRAG